STTLATRFQFTDFEKYFMFLIHKVPSIASKAPLDIMHIQWLDKMNINNKQIILIVVIRDIRDILISKHPLIPDQYFIGFDNSYWPSDEFDNEWNYVAPGIIDIHNKVVLSKTNPNAVIVKYEDLVTYPNDIQKKLAETFDLKFDINFVDYHTKPERLAYTYTGKHAAKDQSLVLEGQKISKKLRKWDDTKYYKRIYDQFNQCPKLFDILIQYGYEQDDQWFDKIEQYIKTTQS
ncbi:hypothetical protein, partial [Oleiphilus sp. HI0080]|uniref:hypothetical protein n=1 Tax=Oleiphilus sp. HI0080 TaxID=1822255 RepID=UPI000B058A92